VISCEDDCKVGLDEVEKEATLWLLQRHHNVWCFEDGAEPKRKREGSAKPYLMVQFDPAPPAFEIA
jgi:hypothetical protein